MRKYSPFLISLLLHTSVLSFLLFNANTSAKKQGGGAPEASQIIPKVTEVEIITDITQGEGVVKKPKKRHADGLTECIGDQWYGGVGIMQDFTSNSISRVMEGYPAEKAGLVVGDVILDVSDEKHEKEIRGDPGTKVELLIKRAGETFTAILIRDRICTQGKE